MPLRTHVNFFFHNKLGMAKADLKYLGRSRHFLHRRFELPRSVYLMRTYDHSCIYGLLYLLSDYQRHHCYNALLWVASLITLMYLNYAPNTKSKQVSDLDSVSTDIRYSMTRIGLEAQKPDWDIPTINTER